MEGSGPGPAPVGVLGAGSLVAASLLPRLRAAGPVVTLSRQSPEGDDGGRTAVPDWISLAPITALPDWLDRLAGRGARRVVALSSTSVLSRTGSSDPRERDLAARLADGERRLAAWADERGIAFVVLRPTLIWGGGRDHNVSAIAGLVRRFGLFPVLGAASGRRQPVHADDVADACLRALTAPAVAGRIYAISGGETLTYREMVERVFAALGRTPRIVSVPLPMFRAAVAVGRLLPGGRNLSVGMAERMNQDLVFDHADAARDLGFSPRPFRPARSDLA